MPPAGGMMPQPGGPPQSPGPVGVQPLPESPLQKEQRKLAMILQAIELLRNDKLRGFRIDIETDSTIQGDAEQEKQARIQFVEGVTKFIETAAQVTSGIPEFAPLAAKMLQFAVRGFRVGRDLESAIEEFAEKAELDAKAKAGQPPKPTPEQVKLQTEQIKAQAEIQAQQIEAQSEHSNLLMEQQIKAMDMKMKQMEMQIQQVRSGAEVKKIGMEMAQTEHEHQSEMKEKHMDGMNSIIEAAKLFEKASRRSAAPKFIKRGADGKATHIITDFKE
jgi:hypothetical protein